MTSLALHPIAHPRAVRDTLAFGTAAVVDAIRELRVRLDEATLAVNEGRLSREPLARATALASWLVASSDMAGAGEPGRRRAALFGYILGELLALAAAPTADRLGTLADVVDGTMPPPLDG